MSAALKTPVRLLAIALAASVLALVPLGASAESADVAYCSDRTTTQTISKRKNISCASARKVVADAQKSFSLPECAGDRARTFRGWRIRAPKASEEAFGIETRFTKSKGNRHFVLSGGGTC